MTMEELVIKYLSEGLNQIEIAERLKKDNIQPNSLSSIEKTLKVIRTKYKAKTMFHLGVILTRTKTSYVK
jgi:hypothetical protein